MKKFTILLFALISANLFAQTATEKTTGDNLVKKIVKTACGKCQFKMKGTKICCLAIEINGKKYLVDGSKMEDHGDPHSKNGLCRKIREAEVSGKVEDNKFLAYDFKLLPIDKGEIKLKEEQTAPPIEDKL